MLLFFKGLVIGLAIAAPVGPIGALCINRALNNGFKIGLLTGLGAAFADGVYGAIAAFGLTSISSILIAHQFWIRLIGGIFLIYLGIKLFFKSAASSTLQNQSDKLAWHAFTTTFLLTMTNPATILSFVAIFAGLGLGSTHSDYIHAILLMLGVFLGSALWWLILVSSIVFFLHHRLSTNNIRFINKLSGLLVLAFGFAALYYVIG